MRLHLGLHRQQMGLAPHRQEGEEPPPRHARLQKTRHRQAMMSTSPRQSLLLTVFFSFYSLSYPHSFTLIFDLPGNFKLDLPGISRRFKHKQVPFQLGIKIPVLVFDHKTGKVGDLFVGHGHTKR